MESPSEIGQGLTRFTLNSIFKCRSLCISSPLQVLITQNMAKTDLESVRRAARLYARNNDAAAALGIDPRSFARICRQSGIETPYSRSLRKRRAAKAESTAPTSAP